MNKIFKGLIRFLIEVIVMTVLIVGINIFTNGMYLWGLPRINDIQSVNITYPSVTDDVKEISSSEDIELALKLTGFLKYDLFGEVNRFTNKVNQFLFDGLSNYYTPSAGDPQNGCPLFLYPKIRKRRNAMPSKTEEYLALAQRTANGLTRYWESWTDYLTTASRLYKYSFADQLMIYAQRPDATACADFDIWNNRMNRYVPRSATPSSAGK